MVRARVPPPVPLLIPAPASCIRRDEDYRRRKDDASRGSRYDRDRYDDDEYYARQREEREDREYSRRPRDDHDRERDRERRQSAYGRPPGDYDKYATVELERRMADLDLERRERDRERELRERDRDLDNRDRTTRRRGSFYGGERPSSTYQAAPGGNYPPAYGSTGTSGNYAAASGGNYPPAGYPPASPRPGDVLPRPVSPYRQGGTLPRPASPYHAAPVAPRPVSPYQAGAIPRAASPYGGGGTGIQRAASPYGAGTGIHRAASPYGGGIQRAASPYGAGAIPRAPSPYGGALPPRAASPYHSGAVGGSIYPPGHVLEGQSGRAASSPYAPPVNLYANPNSTAAGGYGAQAPYGSAYAGSGISSHASPRIGAASLDPSQQGMLSVPEGFNRPPNRAHPYTQFEMLKIGDLDELLEHLPRMPAVLMPHDVYHEDWIRLMTVRHSRKSDFPAC